MTMVSVHLFLKQFTIIIYDYINKHVDERMKGFERMHIIFCIFSITHTEHVFAKHSGAAWGFDKRNSNEKKM